MAFQGSLKELPLPDIIQLVSVSGKTGRFTLARGDEEGVIYLKNGQITHAVLGNLHGEEAIYALAIWSEGDFRFAPGEEIETVTVNKSNTNLLMEAARRLDEWKVLSKKIPSVDLVPELQPRHQRHEQVTLNPSEWSIVTKVDGRRTIEEIGKLLQLSSFEVAKILYGLITSELVAFKKKMNETGESADELRDMADRIRKVAEHYIGQGAHKSLDKYYAIAMDGIDAGDGRSALRSMVTEFEKATGLLRGVGVAEEFRNEVSRIVSL